MTSSVFVLALALTTTIYAVNAQRQARLFTASFE